MNSVMTRLKSLLIACATVVAITAASPASDWPEFRGGPERSGIWNEPGLPSTLPKDGPVVLWKQTLGAGYAGPAVAEGRLFIMDRLKPSATNAADTERLLCLDAMDGKLVWQLPYPRALKLKGGYDNGPRCTPTVRDGRVYALGAMGDLHCVDAKSGAIIWKKDLIAECAAVVPDWGVANAPLLEGKMLILQAGGKPGGTVMAFDKDTGKELWRALDDKAGYSPVIAINSAGRRQLIAWTGEAMCALNPADGSVFWHWKRELAWDQAISVPTFHAERNILLFPSDREGCIALQLGRDKPAASVAWDRTTLGCLHTSPILVGDYIYALNHYGSDKATCGDVRCLSVADGNLVWTEKSVTTLKGFAQATLTRNAANDTWYITNDRGELILARATPAGFKELARAQLTGPTWSHPAYANGRIYSRSETSLVCASLK